MVVTDPVGSGTLGSGTLGDGTDCGAIDEIWTGGGDNVVMLEGVEVDGR